MDGTVEQPKHCWPCKASFADVIIVKNPGFTSDSKACLVCYPHNPCQDDTLSSISGGESKHHGFFSLRGWWWESISSSTSEKLAPNLGSQVGSHPQTPGIHSTELAEREMLQKMRRDLE